VPLPEGTPDFAVLFAALPVGVLLIGPDDRIVRVNAAAEQMLDLSERVMAGRPLATVLPRRGTMPQQQDYAVFDTEITNGRGTAIRVDLSEGEVSGHPGWHVVTLHANARLSQAERGPGARVAVGAAAMLAHEIKNPLSGIRGAAQLLGGGELTTLIVTEVDRIAGLIDRMQHFADTRPLPLASENIYPVLAHARTLAQAGFARGIRIDENFDPSLPHAYINRDALVQVVINLLKNAGEAVQGVPDPAVAISTAYRHGFMRSPKPGEARVALPIEICVLDNGAGAPADISAHLFDPFVSGRPEGQGLGLALVDKLVRDMGGIVQYARENGWTVFRMLLPRAVQ
jgi:two-component system nitrogen regulation sensor histidine kinase GlnL